MARVRVVAAPLAGVVLSIVLLWHTRGLDDVAQPGRLGPGFWPRLALLGLGVSSLAKLVLDVHRARPHDVTGADRVAISTPLLVVAIVMIVAYVAATPVLGFALATLAFVAMFMALSGARSPLTIAATAVGSTVAVLYVFIKLVYLPLPKGAGAVEAVTLVLYRALGIF